MPRYIGAYRGGVRPSAPTTVYRTCALSLPCHSEPVTDVTGVGIRSPRPWESVFLFISPSGQRPPPTFAASRQRRDLIIATPRSGCFQRGRAAALPLWSLKDGDFSRGRKIETSFPLEWRFWLLLSLLTKVTRRRQKEGEKRKHPAVGKKGKITALRHRRRAASFGETTDSYLHSSSFHFHARSFHVFSRFFQEKSKKIKLV